MTFHKYYYLINNSNGCKKRCLNPNWKKHKNKQQNSQSNGNQSNSNQSNSNQSNSNQPPVVDIFI